MKGVIAVCLWITIIYLSTQSQCVSGESKIADNQSESNSSNSINTTTVSQSIVQDSRQNHSIVQLILTLKPGSVLPHIRDEIFYHSDAYNITTEDLINLSDIRSFGFNDTVEALRYLNISDDIFTVNNFKLLLEFSNMSFVEFYEQLKKAPNITTPALLEAMKALNIEASNFSVAIVYGNEDQLYDVLNKGVYTKENWEIAFKELGIDLDTFFKIVKNLILEKIETKDLSYYNDKIHLFLPLMGKKMYDDVWKALNITLVDAYLVPKFREIIEELSSQVNQFEALGMSTSPHEIIVHRKIYDSLEKFLKLMTINAVVVVAPEIIYQDLSFKSEKRDKFAALWNNNSMTFTIEISKEWTNKSDQNCTYITTKGTQVIENLVKITNSSQSSLTAEIENGTMFNIGNPLICRGKLVGLATEQQENNLFIFDSFYRSTEKVSTSGSDDAKTVSIVFIHMIVLYAIRLIH